MPFDLGMFNLSVPIGSFDKAYHDVAIQSRGKGIEAINDRRRAQAIGLHHHAKAIPSRKRGIAEDSLDHI